MTIAFSLSLLFPPHVVIYLYFSCFKCHFFLIPWLFGGAGGRGPNLTSSSFSPAVSGPPVVPLLSPVMSVSVSNPLQRRRSLGPVSPKRIYRNLSVRLRGRESSVATAMDVYKHQRKSADAVRYDIYGINFFLKEEVLVALTEMPHYLYLRILRSYF